VVGAGEMHGGDGTAISGSVVKVGVVGEMERRGS